VVDVGPRVMLAGVALAASQHGGEVCGIPAPCGGGGARAAGIIDTVTEVGIPRADYGSPMINTM